MERWTVYKWLKIAASVGAFCSIVVAGAAAAQTRYGFGQPATPAEIKGWDIDVNGLTGAGLPPGHGSVNEGSNVFEQKCAMCHGDFGEGVGRYPVLAGGKGSLTKSRPIKTVGSYWPYAPTLFDYIRRAMPFPDPQSLTNDQVYALTAYILNLNDIVPDDAVMDAKTLAAVKMPNRDGFVTVHVPDVSGTFCMHDCKPAPVKITSDLVNLHVTPSETEIGDAGSTVDMNASAPARVAVASVPFAKVQAIVTQRCAVCHAAHPSEPGVTAAPMGIMLDTPARIKAAASAIEQQAVKSTAMPLGNVTHMTASERELIGQWITSQAH
jgi:mono/diheme cytochrome c family protein